MSTDTHAHVCRVTDDAIIISSARVRVCVRTLDVIGQEINPHCARIKSG